MINDQGRDATWHIVGSLIAREVKTIDLHLIEGGYMARSDSSEIIFISAVDQVEL